MLHKMFTTLSLVGLLLSAGLWGASYWRITFVLPSWRHAVQLSRGAAQVSWLTGPTVPGNWREQARRILANGGFSGTPGVIFEAQATHNGKVVANYAFYQPGHRVNGFFSWRTDWMPRWSHPMRGVTMLLVPLWIPSVLLAASTWYGFSRYRLCRKKRLGLCQNCGYDLRGSADRCPECGTRIEDAGGCSQRPPE